MPLPLLAAAGISAATSIANGIFGAASAQKQKREQLRAIEQQKAENRNWYNRRMNEDATQRADAQRMLTRANEAIKKRSLAAAGKKAVMGGTDASQAAVQQANAEAMGNAVSDITARADARKDAMESQYHQQQDALTQQASQVKANAEAAKRQAMSQAATGVANAAASVLANMPDGSGKSNAPANKVTPNITMSTPSMAAQAAETNAQLNIARPITEEAKRKKAEEDMYANINNYFQQANIARQ